MPFVAGAQTMAKPEDEYKKLIKVNEDIQPLGDTPFGERIGLYDGSLSFNQTDISLTGTGPALSVGRTFTLHGVEDRPDLQARAFGDWDIDLPQIFTVTASQQNVPGWRVAGGSPTALCSHFGPPPSVAPPPGDAKRADWDPETWWQGYQLRIPGQGSQDLLSRSSANTATPGVAGLAYPIVTRSNWAVGCLAHASNDTTLEGFLAVSPDGTKYWLDHIAYRYMPALTRPLGSGPGTAATRSGIHVFASAQDFVVRREGRMLVTRIEDRFGNSLSYTYSGDDVTDISASDGRHVTFTYETDPSTGTSSHRISTVTVQGGASGTRTWTYHYAKSSPNLVYTLTSVVQPDGSQWGYNLDPLNGAWADSRESGGTCAAIGVPTNMTSTFTATVTHPSGLAASYTVAPLKRGRSYVPQYCIAGPGVPVVANYPGTWASVPNASYGMAITQRVLSGAGLPAGGLRWTYGYSAANESWAQDCNTSACATAISTDVTYPDGHLERSTFSNRYDWTESQLLKEEVFDGGATTTLRRSTTYAYVNPAPAQDARSGAYAHPWGYAPQERVNKTQLQEQLPMATRQTVIDPSASAAPDVYAWNATAFDGFARPQDVTRSNNFGNSISERSTYVDGAGPWVIGLPSQQINLTTGETVAQMTYDATSLTPTARYRFGTQVMGYAFDAQGQLASFTDGNGKTTALSSYVRGIPTHIAYPDNTSQGVGVDGFGQIASITDQAGATTQYGYDAMGRVARIDYPSGDSTAWAPRNISYVYSGDARGMGGNHWMRMVTQGTYSERTDFDALLRPVMTGKAEVGTGALYVSARTEYDWAGHKTFVSYPVSGAPDRSGITLGTTTAYDVLGRPLSSTQSSEQGNLVTTTRYLTGNGRQVTDAKGNVTNTYFQAFDAPSFDSVVRVEAPEGVTQSISRDIYGNVLSLSQGGLTRTMTYDAQHRLCRSWEPETGSTMTAYDAADNVVWSASGQPFNGTGCGYDQVAAAARTTNGYDAMNRVTAVSYPNGTLATSFTYDALGKPATSTSATASGNANSTGTVGWSYGRNKLGLLTAEVLSVDGWSWTLGYGYDANGHLASVQYPDGQTVAMAPNAFGQPTTAGSFLSGATYFPNGSVQAYTLGNGALYSATQNARQLLSNFTFGTAAQVAVSEDYGYDAVGNILTITDRSGSNQRTRAMTYDGLSRLVSATASNLWGSESYTYDTLNNLRTLTNSGGTRTYNYDGNNLLRTISNNGSTVDSFAYDAQGNTTAKDGQAMTFDLANRLLSVNGKGDYLYDATGHRVKAVTPSGTTYSLYSHDGQLLWQFDPVSRVGSDYVYLGKALVAKRAENIDLLHQQDVGVALSLVGVPALSADGSTINITIDINNVGRHALASAGSYPVHVGYHLIDLATGASTEGSVRAALTSSIDVGTHEIVTLKAVASEALAKNKLIRVGLVQEGVAWFQDWGQPTIDVGPYSACPASGTGHLCNTESALRPDQASVTLSFSAGPSLSPDGQSIVANVDIANHGSVTLVSAGTYPVNLGNHIVDATGAIITTDVARAAIPEIAPGQDVSVALATPISLVQGNGRRIQFELVQELKAWFTGLGNTPLNTGPFLTLSAPSTNGSGSYSVTWSGLAGATSYNLREAFNGGGWTTVYASTGTSWNATGRTAGTWSYQLQACASGGCSPWGPTTNVTMVPPPAAPGSVSASAPPAGPVSVSWSSSATASSYVLQSQFNGGGWATVASPGGTTWSGAASSSGTYAYRVQACNGSGCSAFTNSNTVTITLPPTAAPTTSGSGTTNTGAYSVAWSSVPGASTYNLTESANGGAWTTVQNTSAGSWSTSGRGNGTYVYQVQGCNAGGCGPFSGQVTVTVALTPPLPGNIRMADTISGKRESFTISWSASSGATRYEILRVQTNTTLNPGTSTSYVVESGFSPYLLQYTYRLRACNAQGCSAWSGDIAG
ncbi:hypothetical protein P3W24_12025 [Luteibacter sp. PPL201]|uniref:Fibronectin type-III domain-containing protein n=1 Tax=Luteibacter sahnii TaxID=3021977 RepID=A0ABT6BCK0_9GAMM